MDNIDATIVKSDRIEPNVNFENEEPKARLEKVKTIKVEDNVEINKVDDKSIQASNDNSIATDVEQDTLWEDNLQNNHILGKFDSVEMLENAYKSLQAEFTRKSQELANLKRVMNFNNSKTTHLDITDESNSNDNVSNEINDYKVIDKFEEYSKIHNQDQDLIQKIAQKFVDDKKFINDKFGLTLAVYDVMKDRVEDNEKKLSSNEYLFELVNSNEIIKEKIINEYINNCTKGVVPPLMVNTYGANMVASTPNMPTTLDEVANIMNKWLNK